LRKFSVSLGCNHMDVKSIAAFTVQLSQLPLILEPRKL
jgi:hypothetical protein